MIKIELDMDMPKTCYECPFGLLNYTKNSNFKIERRTFACILTGRTMTATKRSRFCPIRSE